MSVRAISFTYVRYYSSDESLNHFLGLRARLGSSRNPPLVFLCEFTMLKERNILQEFIPKSTVSFAMRKS